MTGGAADDVEFDALLLRFQAVADTVRQSLLDVLHVDGPQTMASLRRKVPAAKGSLRWDLARLEQAGVVAREGEGRTATWDVVRGAIGFTEQLASHPRTAAAVQEFDRVLTERRITRLRAWAAERHTRLWNSEWSDASISRDYLLRLTASELDELDAEIHERIDAMRQRSVKRRAAGEVVAGEEAVFITVGGFPFRLGRG
ncbi:MAG: helix-turn-helix domain-containing protein [Lapillicoccus sp.]